MRFYDMDAYKEGYCFVSRKAVRTGEIDELDEDGGELISWQQDLPENFYCETLGRLGYRGPGEGPHDDICLVRMPAGDPEPPGLRPVSSDLKQLLRAGQVYKPALAIANEVGSWAYSGDPTKTEAEAVEKFTRVLRYELENQRSRPFFLAKAIPPNKGELWPGDYYWIIDYEPAKKEPIWWVTDDYWLYTASITDFEVDAAYLAERFAVRPKAGV